MPKIVGLVGKAGTSKKTGKPYNAVFVSVADDYSPEDIAAGAVGNKVEEIYINRDIFDIAAASRTFKEVLGKPCHIFYNRNGFIDTMVID